MVPALHLTEETFTLHFFLKRFQCLIDIVVAYDDLNDGSISRTCQKRKCRTRFGASKAYLSANIVGPLRIQSGGNSMKDCRRLPL